jgi:hypothetical protein
LGGFNPSKHHGFCQITIFTVSACFCWSNKNDSHYSWREKCSKLHIASLLIAVGEEPQPFASPKEQQSFNNASLAFLQFHLPVNFIVAFLPCVKPLSVQATVFFSGANGKECATFILRQRYLTNVFRGSEYLLDKYLEAYLGVHPG